MPTNDTLSTAPGDTLITDPYVPVDIHGDPLQWDENDAHMAGLLFEVKQHYDGASPSSKHYSFVRSPRSPRGTVQVGVL